MGKINLKKKKFNSIPLLVLAFFVFLGIYLYPFISDRWNAYRNSQLIAEYQQTVIDDNLSDDKNISDREYEKAKEYNKNLANTTDKVITKTEKDKDPEYESILDRNGDGMMGFIEIPKLQMQAPIYHYSTEDIIGHGIGHIYGSSFPVGGSNTHSVLTGHRGLPYSKLFTDLDQVEVGDKFYIHVEDHDLAYEVYDIRTVLPKEVDSLLIKQGEDLVTLVTCTPYGVNSHRLLVTGKRCKYDVEVKQKEDEEGKALQIENKINPQNAMVIGLIVFVSVILGSMAVSKRKSAKQKKEREDAVDKKISQNT